MAGGGEQWRGRSVISKVTVLLDAFTTTRRELTLGELAGITGLPMSTTYRLAAELVRWGGLERVDGGVGYRIGTRLWELGALAPHGRTLREVALPFMRDLNAATGEDVHLAVLDGTVALPVEAIAGHPAAGTRPRRGGRLPLHATAVGKVLLAHAPGALLREVVEAGLRRYTPHTVVAPGPLAAALAEVRRDGIAVAHGELALGTVAVAAPVAGTDGQPSGALAVVVRSGRADVGRLGPAVRTTALSIARTMQGR